MPGLAELKAGAARVRVEYQQLGDGARLVYSSTDPKPIQAVHDWFDAQSTSHGH